jgi:hypothetical protein
MSETQKEQRVEEMSEIYKIKMRRTSRDLEKNPDFDKMTEDLKSRNR